MDHANSDDLKGDVPFAPRGHLSKLILDRLQGARTQFDEDLLKVAQHQVRGSESVRNDDDLQLALFCLYTSVYGSVEAFKPDLEWDLDLIAVRKIIEEAFEAELRDCIPVPPLPAAQSQSVARSLFDLAGDDAAPGLPQYFAREATHAQAREFLIQRSIYTLREADPHSWAIPRLTGRAKAALVEIQTDEYGGGRPHRVHAELFAQSMQAVGLDIVYAGYVDNVHAIDLASVNMMSMFGLNRRLVGAIVGHLAAFEMTSSIPNRFYGNGFRRLGYSSDVTNYFDEHVEADAVHEQIAGRDMAGSLAEDRPDLLSDIMFGAAAGLAIGQEISGRNLARWQNGDTALRKEEKHE